MIYILNAFKFLGHGSGDGISRLSPVLEQLDILEIKQSTNGKVSANEAGSTTVENVPSNVPVTNGGSANSEAEEEATPASKKTKVIIFISIEIDCSIKSILNNMRYKAEIIHLFSLEGERGKTQKVP